MSIHANASPSRALRGFEVYYLSEATDDGALAVERAENSALRWESMAPPEMGRRLKTILWDLRESENRKESLRVAQKVVDAVSGTLSVGPQRIRSANFFVLKWTECPSVLIETGYVTNKQDERLLRSSVHKQALAEAIVNGIWNYKTEYEATDGFTR